eukprot:g60814.t1
MCLMCTNARLNLEKKLQLMTILTIAHTFCLLFVLMQAKISISSSFTTWLYTEGMNQLLVTIGMSDNEPEEQHEEPDNKQAEEKKVPDPAVEEVIEGVVA